MKADKDYLEIQHLRRELELAMRWERTGRKQLRRWPVPIVARGSANEEHWPNHVCSGSGSAVAVRDGYVISLGELAPPLPFQHIVGEL